MRAKVPVVLLVSLLVQLMAIHGVAAPRFRAGWETGPAYVVQNEGRYGEMGTEFDAEDTGQQKTLPRVERAFIELGRGRHQLIFTYIPLELRTRVELARELRFRDEVFPAGTVVDHRYLFDGFRASYLYDLLATSECVRSDGACAAFTMGAPAYNLNRQCLAGPRRLCPCPTFPRWRTCVAFRRPHRPQPFGPRPGWSH